MEGPSKGELKPMFRARTMKIPVNNTPCKIGNTCEQFSAFPALYCVLNKNSKPQKQSSMFLNKTSQPRSDQVLFWKSAATHTRCNVAIFKFKKMTSACNDKRPSLLGIAEANLTIPSQLFACLPSSHRSEACAVRIARCSRIICSLAGPL